MGTGFHGGFGNTEGAKNNETHNLIKELESNGVKFSKEDIVFITKDKTGQTIWLEKGNSAAGLEHIIQRHSRDFAEKHGINSANISTYLKQVFLNGKIEYARQTYKSGKTGYEKLYNYKGQYYLLTGVGTNGFIVTAYPIDEAAALKLKGRYGK